MNKSTGYLHTDAKSKRNKDMLGKIVTLFFVLTLLFLVRDKVIHQHHFSFENGVLMILGVATSLKLLYEIARR